MVRKRCDEEDEHGQDVKPNVRKIVVVASSLAHATMIVHVGEGGGCEREIDNESQASMNSARASQRG